MRSNRALAQPGFDGFGDELRTVVAADALGLSAPTDEFLEDPHDIARRQAPCTTDRQSFTGKLIDNRQASQALAVDRLVVHKVVAPHVVRMTGSVNPLRRSPQQPLFPAFAHHLESLSATNQTHAFSTDSKSVLIHQIEYLSVTPIRILIR